ncbi:hypothetical protein ALC56_06735, partial [Trachymyrmex septentrionalis]
QAQSLYNLNQSLHRKNIVELLACCTCGQDPCQDVNHVVSHYHSERKRSITSHFPDCDFNLFPLLRHPPPKLCRLLLAYFKSIDIHPYSITSPFKLRARRSGARAPA